jgi:hypothetical protein
MGIPGKGHAKVLTAGVGWAGADILLSQFHSLWFGARGAEFDWVYIQKSFDSNTILVSHIHLQFKSRRTNTLESYLFR